MSTNIERPPEAAAEVIEAALGGLEVSAQDEAATPLGALPVGARLVLRCRKDWRAATIVAVEPDVVTLAVCSPRGTTYRVRRPSDAPLNFHGAIPLLGEGAWRANFARYDTRW